MAANFRVRESLGFADFDSQRYGQRYHVIVALDDEQLAAVEGWRIAQGIPEQSEALSNLVRIGLLSEIAKLYRLIADNRDPTVPNLYAPVRQKANRKPRRNGDEA